MKKLVFLALCLSTLWWGSAWAESPSESRPEDSLNAQTPSPAALYGGLGVFHYREPGLMQLSGPEARLQWRRQAQGNGWPQRLQLDASAALLRYSSAGTGDMDRVPALSARGTALWGLGHTDSGPWHAGLQLDLVWTDLRGTSSSGHHGYRRLGSKVWAVLQHELAPGADVQIGALLLGRQDSLLSDIGHRDISNSQRKGIFLAYQHSPITGTWRGMRPWLRYSDVRRSDLDGGFYEPRNRLVQAGVLFDF